MASHKQIDTNINDTLGAWGQLQAMLAQWMPQSAQTISNFARGIARAKRRF